MKRTKQQNKKENNGGFNMIKTLRKQLKNEKGLTLIELLAVIVILAIIAAIAIPAIGNIIENSRAKALVSDSVNVMNAANMYFMENETDDPVGIADLATKGYLESKGKLTDVTEVTFASGGNTIKAVGDNGNVTLNIDGATLQQLTDSKVTVVENVVKLSEFNPVQEDNKD